MPLGDATLAVLAAALRNPAVVARYRAKTVTVPGSDCRWWSGVASGRGHRRFYVRSGRAEGCPPRLVPDCALRRRTARRTWASAHAVFSSAGSGAGRLLPNTRADRRRVVAQVLAAADVDALEADRLAADCTLPDVTARLVRADADPDETTYVAVIAASSMAGPVVAAPVRGRQSHWCATGLASFGQSSATNAARAA